MRGINLHKKNGSVNGLMVMMVLLLAVSLPVTVLLVQKNQENRSNAASETTNEVVDSESDITDISGVCGGADGKSYASRPTNDLCSSGSVLWKDSSGNDGSYLWSCIGENDTDDMASTDCSAIKLSKDEGGAIDGRCGDTNGTNQSSKPNSSYVLCKSGDLNWIDDKADDGEFNWSCKGINEGNSVDCSAFKTEGE